VGWQVMPYQTAADVIDLPIFYARPHKNKGDFLCGSLLAHILKLTQPVDSPWIGPFMLRASPSESSRGCPQSSPSPSP
jgi:hypothetical protein